MKIKVLGHVDLQTGKVYDNNDNEVSIKESFRSEDNLKERLERRRAWLAGEFNYF